MTALGFLAATLRALAAFAAVCVVATVWVRCATYACFPIGGGEFHGVLHLPKAQRVAGIQAFAAVQVAITTTLAVTLACASLLKLRTVLLLNAVPVLISNAAVLSLPWAGLAVVTGLPFFALAGAVWVGAARWPPRLPALLVALPSALWGTDRVADFVHFFPAEVVFPIADRTLPGACLLAVATVLLVRRSLVATRAPAV